MKKWIYYGLIVFFSLALVGSAAYLGAYYWDSYQQSSRYQALSEMVDKPTRPTIREEDQQEAEIPTVPTVPTTPPDMLVEVTDAKGNTRQVMHQFVDLFQMNNDMIGWLTIPGTDIDYPVMQTPGRKDYYLKRNFDKKYSARGCLYVRETCDVFTPGDNVTIYGHRMKDRTMFAQLDQYMKKDFFEANPYIYFDNLEQMHTYKVMAVFTTSANPGQGFNFHQFENAANEKEFHAFVSTCKRLSWYNTGVSAVYGDKLICLSTCEYSQENGRLVIVAKMVG